MNCFMKSSLETCLWYSQSQWPLTSNLKRTRSIVTSCTAPLSNTFSTSQGPSQRVMSLPWFSWYLESYIKAQSPAKNFLVLMCLSCHLFLCCWITSVCYRVAFLISSKAFSCRIRSFCASDKSMLSSRAILKVLCSNSMGNIAIFPQSNSKGVNLVLVFHVVL